MNQTIIGINEPKMGLIMQDIKMQGFLGGPYSTFFVSKKKHEHIYIIHNIQQTQKKKIRI